MEKDNAKKIVFSGIQPTGSFTLGNYIGAVRNWPLLQDEYNCIYSVVDQHALTVRQDPATLRKRTYEAYAMLLASGIDPERSMVFVQSHNPIHAQLNWILACNVQYGELTRMTQFKDKSAKHPENINGGLLTYPVLMAADILAYNAAAVPVGIDQKQHVELARNIAQRFNSVYGETFVMPEAVIPKVGAKIMSLQDPTKKMSKSDENQNNIITLMDDPKVIMNKMKRAMTDSDNEIRFGEDKPGISNLLSIYCAVTGKTIPEAEREFAGMGYGTFKTAVGEAVVADLEPVQKRVKELEANKDYLDAIIKDGAEKASRLADRTLSKVQRKVGFPNRIR